MWTGVTFVYGGRSMTRTETSLELPHLWIAVLSVTMTHDRYVSNARSGWARLEDLGP